MIALPRHSEISSAPYLGASRSYWDNESVLQAGRNCAGEHRRGGLPTPPATSDMTTASLSNGNHAYRQSYPYLTEQRIPTSSSIEARSTIYPANGVGSAGNTYDGRPYTNGYAQAVPTHQPKQEDQIASHLQIPESVNSSKGSLAEFAAEMTCLFWFETSATLRYAEALPHNSPTDCGLHPDAVPSIGFTKWVATILSTTQVGKNVVLLALMFIYRLKKVNPDVSGKRGSEFRLLTIALMLGNKFLDDNTYTNKTWAEVSGISVNEIHIMEVEFLSNMRYALYASEAQWKEWKSKLGRFGSFYEKANRFNSPTNISPITPVTQTFPHKLPSPPTSRRNTNGSYAGLPNPLHTMHQLPRSPARPISSIQHPFERKRSLDTSQDLPPAKRLHSLATSTGISPEALTPTSAYTPDSTNTAVSYESPARFPQLPVPTLPYPTNQNGTPLSTLTLPGPRAMSAVYQSSANSSQAVTPVSMTSQNFPTLPMPGTNMSNHNASQMPSHAGSARTSPTNLYGVSTPTRPGLSPSYFLMNRSSPYRPVRHVNTLLHPQPSAAMQNTVKPIDYEQMHYQPLSKNSNQLRAGPMPCLQPDAWQGSVATPVNQPYRPY